MTANKKGRQPATPKENNSAADTTTLTHCCDGLYQAAPQLADATAVPQFIRKPFLDVENGFWLSVVELDGAPWFVAMDVAKALGYRDAHNMARRLDDNEVRTLIVSTNGGDREATIINESGLYSVILKSRKPEARRFKSWVTDVVLPSIRQNGGYVIGQEVDSSEVFLAKAVAHAHAVITRKTAALKAAEHQLAVAAPKAEFYDSYADAGGSFGFRQTAKTLGIKELDFSEFLTDRGIMYYLGEKLTAKAPHIKAGRFIQRAGVAKNGHAYTESRFTPKGIAWIASLLAEGGTDE